MMTAATVKTSKLCFFVCSVELCLCLGWFYEGGLGTHPIQKSATSHVHVQCTSVRHITEVCQCEHR